MSVASQFLHPRACRIASLAAALVTAVFVVGGGSPKPHYMFFAACELAAMAGICALVWKPSPV